MSRSFRAALTAALTAAMLIAGASATAMTEPELPAPSPSPSGTPSPADTNGMVGGQTLSADQRLVSPNGTYEFAFQGDGNAVVYRTYDRRVLFSSDSYGNYGARFDFQYDGNAVIYAANGRPVWDSGTWRDRGARLEIQNDGNLVIYRSNGSAAWSTGWDRTWLWGNQELLPGQRIASPSGRYYFTLQKDGNVVSYASSGRPIFASNSYGATRLVMQSDGNLVAYAGSRAVWDTGTWTEGWSHFDVQDDGNVVVYNDRDGWASWRSGWDTGANYVVGGQRLPRPAPAPQPGGGGGQQSGQPSAPPPGPDPNRGADVDCDDFRTEYDAQTWWNYWNPRYDNRDPWRLDGNGNKKVCEHLP